MLKIDKEKKTQLRVLCNIDPDVVSKTNSQIVQDLQDPKWGYKLQHQWTTDDTFVNDGTFSVYAPDYRRSWRKRSEILWRTLGGVESTVFNMVSDFEDKGAINPFTGVKTYEPFTGGLYDLCLGVWEIPKQYSGIVYGADKGYLPNCGYAIVPLLQHSRGPDINKKFLTAYERPKFLYNLHAMIARGNFSTHYTNPFNTKREESIENMYKIMWGQRSHTTDYNWLSQYDTTYKMYRSTLGGGNGESDVKVTAGDRYAVVRGALDLHSVMD
jgi:hypothetical protein